MGRGGGFNNGRKFVAPLSGGKYLLNAFRLKAGYERLLPLNLRGALERDAGAQAFDHSLRDDEQGLRQIVQIIPIPSVTLFRFHQLWLASRRFANEVDVNVMALAVFTSEHVIAYREQSQIGDLQPCLFADFAAGGLLKALVELDVAARGGVMAFAVRASAAAQQHAPTPHHQDAHSDMWSMICCLHLKQP